MSGALRMRGRWGLGIVLAALLAGCAPHVAAPPSLLPSGEVEARFRAALERRRTEAAVANGTWSLWAHEAGRNDPPGVTARMLVEPPDAFRLRVDGILGTAVDAAARGDSLVLDAPSLGLAAVDDHVIADATGGTPFGSFVCRMLGALWEPPPGAWEAARLRDSLTTLAWQEGPDSVALAIGATGLPREVRLRAGGGPAIRGRYERWDVWDGIAWPQRVVLSDAGNRFRLICQVESVKLRREGAYPAVTLRVPARALPLTGERWKRLIRNVPYIARGQAPTDTLDAPEPRRSSR